MLGDIAVDSISDYRVSGSIGSELRQRRRGDEPRGNRKKRGKQPRKGVTTYYIFIFLAPLRLPQMASLELKAAIHLLNHLLCQHKHLQHDKQNRS